MASRKRPRLDDVVVIETNLTTVVTPSLVHLPEEVQSVVLSYCDFRSLINLRITNRLLKSVTWKEFGKREKYILRSILPFEFRVTATTATTIEEEDTTSNVQAILRLGWSDVYSTKRRLIREAITYANPPNIDVEEEANTTYTYDENKARRLFRHRWRQQGQNGIGWIDNTDFKVTNQNQEEDDDDGGGMYRPTDPGWGVLIKQGRFMGRLSWGILSDMLSNFDKFSTDNSYDPRTLLLMREYMSVLLLRSKPLSVNCGYRQYDYFHPTHPSGGKEGSLMFYTSSNSRIELFMTCTM